jgi:hypothetical protein
MLVSVPPSGPERQVVLEQLAEGDRPRGRTKRRVAVVLGDRRVRRRRQNEAVAVNWTLVVLVWVAMMTLATALTLELLS